MATQNNAKLANATDGIAVYGYIRENFDKKCWIERIIRKIIQFYLVGGGSLYMCGYDKNGKLGVKEYKYENLGTPILCPPFIDNNTLQVSAGGYHTLILDTNGDVWCCGLGEDGQLGTGKKDILYKPTKLPLITKVIAVEAGPCHSLLLFDDGTVKGFGTNVKGAMGLGDLEKTFVPKTIEKLKKYQIIQICAGRDHSAALTKGGKLFCFGDNWNGQCGVGKDKGNKIKVPTKVDFDDEIEFVDCGNVHTLIISRKGLFYSFGYNYDGGLGHGDKEVRYTPTLIEALKEKKIKACAAGGCHSLCSDKEGIIWSFGGNYHGQCALTKWIIKQQTTPVMIPWFIENNVKGNECFAGVVTSSVIATDGSLYVFGSNAYYRLGLNEVEDHYTPQKMNLPKHAAVQSMSMGKEHTAIICSVEQ